jgi:hypothetical protein
VKRKIPSKIVLKLYELEITISVTVPKSGIISIFFNMCKGFGNDWSENESCSWETYITLGIFG